MSSCVAVIDDEDAVEGITLHEILNCMRSSKYFHLVVFRFLELENQLLASKDFSRYSESHNAESISHFILNLELHEIYAFLFFQKCEEESLIVSLTTILISRDSRAVAGLKAWSHFTLQFPLRCICNT